MRAIVLATTALAVLALAVPARAQTTDPVVAIVNGTQLKKSDLEAAYASAARSVSADAARCDLRSAARAAWSSSTLLLAAAPTRRISPTIPRSRRRSPGRMTACCATRWSRRRSTQGITDEKLQRRLRGDEEPAGLRVRGDACRAYPGRRRGRGAGDHQAARRAGPTSRPWPRRSRPTPRPRPTAAISAISGARRWCPSSPRPRSRSQPGTIGDKPVKSQFGWHVIKVEDRRQTVPTFEEKEPELREQLSREIVTALLADVRTGATIELLQHRRHARSAK